MNEMPGSQLYVLLIWILITGCAQEEGTVVFDLEGTSEMVIENRSEDTLSVVLENWQLFPYEAQTVDTLISPGGVLPLPLVARGNTTAKLTLNETSYAIFLQPATANGLEFSNGEELNFTGDLAEINTFLLAKAEHFGSPDAEWIPRTNFTHGGYTTEELLRGNDSITTLHLDYLAQYAAALPQWYVSFEQRRQRYLNAGFKLNSIFYRKSLLGNPEPVPPDLLPRVMDDLPVADEELLGNIWYQNFVTEYLGARRRPDMVGSPPASRAAWAEHYAAIVETGNTFLEGKMRDVYLAKLLEHIILEKQHLYREEWMALIEDATLRDYLVGLWEQSPALAAGTSVPNFNLVDTLGRRVTPEAYAGKVTLINFWATWCRPCIQEFPRENELVREFADEPVRIVNICIDSKEQTWRNMIAKHELITDNLFAPGDWSDRLYERFAIQGLPHSILIDAAGQVVQNNCPRASDGIATDIRALLPGSAINSEEVEK